MGRRLKSRVGKLEARSGISAVADAEARRRAEQREVLGSMTKEELSAYMAAIARSDAGEAATPEDLVIAQHVKELYRQVRARNGR